MINCPEVMSSRTRGCLRFGRSRSGIRVTAGTCGQLYTVRLRDRADKSEWPGISGCTGRIVQKVSGLRRGSVESLSIGLFVDARC